MSSDILLNIFGWSATVLICMANLAQVIKTLKSRKTSGLSFYTYTLLLIGTVFWLTYGILLINPPLICFNSINLIFMGIVYSVMIFNKTEEMNIQMKDKPEQITLGKGYFVYWPDADEYGRLPQKAVTRHPQIVCPRCDYFYKSGGGDNLGLRYKCSRCGLEWYREEDFEYDKEYLLQSNPNLPKQIIVGLWIYKLERRYKKSPYVKYVKKNKLMKEKKCNKNR